MKNVNIQQSNCLKPGTLNGEREDHNYNVELKAIFISNLQADILQTNLPPPLTSV